MTATADRGLTQPGAWPSPGAIPAHLATRYADALPGYRLYLDREHGRERPDGRTDNGGRWYPAPCERRACCECVRPPSRLWPWSLYAHAHSARHCSTLAGVEPRRLRGLLSALAAYKRPAATAPADLCPTCGASWPCEHMPDDRAIVDALAAQAGVRLIPSYRADMSRHLP